jgi:hypothetical protein
MRLRFRQMTAAERLRARPLSSPRGREIKMRDMISMISAAAAVAVLGFGASTALALPANSPYAIFVPQSVDPGVPTSAWGTGPQTRVEGRAAAVGQGSAPVYAPDVQTVPTPEDRTIYSRGK